ncbi:MAG TPA: hypothetical protein VMR75_00045 [Candidatus Saccharimonadales bacterium]|nr:hypothetical protein [Candidatus Saccharimonadales bacterium]
MSNHGLRLSDVRVKFIRVVIAQDEETDEGWRIAKPADANLPSHLAGLLDSKSSTISQLMDNMARAGQLRKEKSGHYLQAVIVPRSVAEQVTSNGKPASQSAKRTPSKNQHRPTRVRVSELEEADITRISQELLRLAVSVITTAEGKDELVALLKQARDDQQHQLEELKAENAELRTELQHCKQELSDAQANLLRLDSERPSLEEITPRVLSLIAEHATQ